MIEDTIVQAHGYVRYANTVTFLYQIESYHLQLCSYWIALHFIVLHHIVF